MRRSALIAVALALVLLAATIHAAENRHARTQPTANSRVPWYSRSEAPQGWTQLEAAAPTEPLTFTVVVKGSNADELERRFWARSDPDSAEFGDWMSNSDIEQLVAPSPAQLRRLYGALAEHGIAAGQVTSHGDSFDVAATVRQASSLFATRFFRFQHSATGAAAIRQWGDYSLPAAIAEQAELVLGVHTFPTVQQRLQMRARRAAARARDAAKRASSAAATAVWVPQALAAVYGVPHPIAPLAYSEVSAGVIEWEGETFSEKDLMSFSNNTAIPLVPVDQHHIYGNGTKGQPGIEASLDIQWLEGLNPGVTPWFWLVPGANTWMYTFTVEFLSAADFPKVISMSYGVPELDNCDPSWFGKKNDCNGVSYQAYQALVDKQFQKMGLMGVTILSANSDNGVYNVDLAGSDSGAPKPDIFLPNYPGTSPFVTTAGATEMSSPVFSLANPPHACSQGRNWACISNGTEQAVSNDIAGFLSGGGFSNVTTRPDYQTAAVSAYLSSGVTLPDESLWNRSGRAIPDVTAQGWNGYVVDAGTPVPVSGTSMSTPIVASILALVSHDYYAITNATIGFVNQILYKGQGAGAGLFTDITIGDNCDDEQCKDGHVGFECTIGWDPVSGLGSPNYPNMKKYVQQLAQRVMERRAKRQQQK